jgi:uncharacterized protein YxjI
MRYQMMEKSWAFGDDSRTRKVRILFCCWQASSLGKKLSFEDMQGRELAFISRKLLRFKSTCEIYREGTLFADVVKEISFSSPHLKSMSPDRMTHRSKVISCI